MLAPQLPLLRQGGQKTSGRASSGFSERVREISNKKQQEEKERVGRGEREGGTIRFTLEQYEALVNADVLDGLTEPWDGIPRDS